MFTFGFQAMSLICVPKVTLSFFPQTLLFSGIERKDCLFSELDLESDKIFP